MSVEQHRDDVGRLLAGLGGGASPGGEIVDVDGALGRVSARDVRAPQPLPRFRNSQMDGFAVRAADVTGATSDAPVSLPVAGEIAAAPGGPAPLEPGTTVRIMTGAPLPDGADAVVPVEDTDHGTFNRLSPPADRLPPSGHELQGAVRIGRSRAVGEFVREAGSDVGAGDLVLPAGTVLAGHHLAAAAACGIGRLPVRRRIRVAIVSTGSELVAPGRPAGPGQIWDANAVALAAGIRAAGGEVAHTHRIGDDPDTARRVLTAAASSSDLMVTSGGVSQGAHEVIKDVLSDVVFRPVAMQPGGPQGLGTLDGTPVLTFPGNPVSTQVSFVVFLRDVLRRAAGLAPIAGRRVVVGRAGDAGGGTPTRSDGAAAGRAGDGAGSGTGDVDARGAADALASPPGRRQFLRGRLPGDGTVDVVGGAGSHLVASMAVADVLIDVPADVTGLRSGDEVEVIPL